MRTNIDIDDKLMDEVMVNGPFKTKKEAVEAGLMLLTQQAAMRELVKLGGAVSWGWGDEERLDGQPNWRLVDPEAAAKHGLAEPVKAGRSKPPIAAKTSRSAPAPESRAKSRAGR